MAPRHSEVTKITGKHHPFSDVLDDSEEIRNKHDKVENKKTLNCDHNVIIIVDAVVHWE